MQRKNVHQRLLMHLCRPRQCDAQCSQEATSAAVSLWEQTLIAVEAFGFWLFGSTVRNYARFISQMRSLTMLPTSPHSQH